MPQRLTVNPMDIHVLILFPVSLLTSTKMSSIHARSIIMSFVIDHALHSYSKVLLLKIFVLVDDFR